MKKASVSFHYGGKTEALPGLGANYAHLVLAEGSMKL